MAADDPRGGDPTRREVLGAGAASAVAALVARETPASAAPAPEPVPSASPRGPPSIDIVCRECGGNNVSRDAWAEWDVASQQWMLGSVFDHAYCHDCGEKASLDEVPAATD
jgi:hypothetical protein